MLTRIAAWSAFTALAAVILAACLTVGLWLSIPSQAIGDWWSPDYIVERR